MPGSARRTPSSWPSQWLYVNHLAQCSPRWLAVLARPRRTSRLARHPVAEVDDARPEGAGLDEFEIHPALALRKERNATAHQHRVDPGPVLVDQTQRGR